MPKKPVKPLKAKKPDVKAKGPVVRSKARVEAARPAGRPAPKVEAKGHNCLLYTSPSPRD